MQVWAHPPQTFMDMHMRTMSYTGTDGKDIHLLGIITGSPKKEFTCHLFRCIDAARTCTARCLH